MNPIEIIPREEVAAMLKTSPDKVTAAIRNGTMPIGAVAGGDDGTRERTIIIKRRLERWLAGEDLREIIR